MAGLRDFIAHRYFRVREDIIARTVQRELPGVQREVKRLLDQ